MEKKICLSYSMSWFSPKFQRVSSFQLLPNDFFFSMWNAPHVFMTTLLSRFVWHKQKGGQDDPRPWWRYFCQNTFTSMARASRHLCHVRVHPRVITSKLYLKKNKINKFLAVGKCWRQLQRLLGWDVFNHRAAALSQDSKKYNKKRELCLYILCFQTSQVFLTDTENLQDWNLLLVLFVFLFLCQLAQLKQNTGLSNKRNKSYFYYVCSFFLCVFINVMFLMCFIWCFSHQNKT